LQTDNTLFIKDKGFAKKEQVKLKEAKFIAKEREYLTPSHNLKFNSSIIHLKNNRITLTQERQYTNLNLVHNKNTTTTNSKRAIRQNLSTKDQYVAQRAKGAYIALVCQPEATYNLSIAAQATKLAKKDVKALNKCIK
jgi:hypothetical protein